MKEFYTPVWVFLCGLYMFIAGKNGADPGIIAALAGLCVLAWLLSPDRYERIEWQREQKHRRAEYRRLQAKRKKNSKAA